MAKASKSIPEYHHPYHWLVEPIIEDPSYVERRMFGSLGCYINGKLVLILSAQEEEPWNGVMIATSKEFHASLLKECPALISHPVLGKWLYISEGHPRFESTVQWVVEQIVLGDERVGVAPKEKKKGRRGSKNARKKAA